MAHLKFPRLLAGVGAVQNQSKSLESTKGGVMKKFMTKGLIVLALLATAFAFAEGDGPRARARQLQKKKEAAARVAEAREAARLSALDAAVPAPAASQPDTRTPAEKCKRTDAQWVDWRDEKIGTLLTLDETQTFLDIHDVMARSTSMANELDECAKVNQFPPESIMRNFTAFVNANRNYDYQSDLKHQFGHKLDDHEYLKRIEPQVTVPCLLQHPTFLDHLTSPSTYHLAWKLIERHNQPDVTEVLGCPTHGEKWKALVYRSQFLSTPDDAEAFGRFFVFVEGKDYDRWIQFGAWLPEDKEGRKGDYEDTIYNMSVVSVAKSEDPRANNRFDAMADWWRLGRDGEFGLGLKFRRQTPPYESDNCIRCHKVVPIGIHPATVYEFNGEELLPVANADQINTFIKEYARADAAKDTVKAEQLYGKLPGPVKVLADLQKYISTNNYRRAPVYEVNRDDVVASPSSYGPAFGPDEKRPVESLQACAAPISDPLSLGRIGEAMRCAQCHNGEPPGSTKHRFKIGLLNFPLATEKRTAADEVGNVPNLIRAHILSGVMPPDHRKTELNGEMTYLNLNEQERNALYDCLSHEYFTPATSQQRAKGLFVDWLMNNPTATAATGTNVAALKTQKSKPRVTPISTGTHRQ